MNLYLYCPLFQSKKIFSSYFVLIKKNLKGWWLRIKKKQKGRLLITLFSLFFSPWHLAFLDVYLDNEKTKKKIIHLMAIIHSIANILWILENFQFSRPYPSIYHTYIHPRAVLTWKPKICLRLSEILSHKNEKKQQQQRYWFYSTFAIVVVVVVVVIEDYIIENKIQ